MSTSTLKTEEVPLSNQSKPKMESKPKAVLGVKAHAYEKLCSTILIAIHRNGLSVLRYYISHIRHANVFVALLTFTRRPPV